MRPTSDPIVQDILLEGLDDWVPVDAVIGASRTAAEESSEDFRQIATAVIDDLVGGGLMVPGDLGSTGFEEWRGAPDELVRRVVDVCTALQWHPQGAACWLSNTARGDQAARAVTA